MHDLLLALLAGTLAGLAAGLMPGVSGRAGLILVTPLAIGMGPMAGAVFLVAFHSVIHTSGSVPAILLGAPTSAAEAATVIDGHAMTRKGEGPRAVGASLAASAVGGVIGALLLLLLAPIAMGAVRFIGAPETAAISILGLLSISALSAGGKGGLAHGMISACIGVIVASVGINNFTGDARFTLGLPELAEGINAATIVTGLFVVPELAVARWPRIAAGAAGLDKRAVLSGFFEALRHRWLLLRTSVLGTVVGLIPGLGASVAVWIAYGHARQTEPSAVAYGEGAIAGVIAPEAANNSKEGGSLAPTLFFGVPSSSGMGILLAAFLLIGVEVGPRMMTHHPEFVYLMGFTNIASNLVAVPLCLLILPLMARLASIRGETVAPIALAAGIAASWMTEPLPLTLVMIAIFSTIGLLLKAADIPRAPLLLGFVLAPSIESGVTRATMIQGSDAFGRPGVLVILALAILILAPAALRALGRRTGDASPAAPPSVPPVGVMTAALAVAALIMLAGIFGLPGTMPASRVMPGLAAVIGLVAIGTCLPALFRRDGETKGNGRPDARLLLLAAAMLAAIPVVGAAPAATLFVLAALLLCAKVEPLRAAAAAAMIGTAIFFLGAIPQ